MKYKDDWPRTKERLEALWKGEIVDRCCFAAMAPRKNARYRAPRIPESPTERLAWWCDPAARVKFIRAYMEATYYGGEAFPQAFTYYGAAGHAAFFKGATYQLANVDGPNSGNLWFTPSPTACEQPLEFDPGALLYRKTLELARAYVEDSRGDYFVSQPDINGNVDALAHLWGSEEVLMRMLTDKETVHAALEKLQAAWRLLSEQIYEITRGNNEGGQTVGWLYTWAEGRHAQMQSDMSVMISPELHREFVLPELIAQAEWMDRSLYHFDGADQTKHLDALLSLERLSIIQWTCVAGQPEPMHFIDTLKRIQAAGKRLLIIVQPGWIEPLMTALSSRGLYLICFADSEEQAKDMLKLAARLTHD